MLKRRLAFERLENRRLFYGADVNGDGAIQPVDVLEVVNAINQGAPYEESHDVNGDQIVSAVDTLIVVNEVNKNVCAVAPMVSFRVVPATATVGELASIEYTVLNGCQSVPVRIMVEVVSEVTDPLWDGVVFTEYVDLWRYPDYVKLDGVIAGLAAEVGREQYLFQPVLTGNGSMTLSGQVPDDVSRIQVIVSWGMRIHGQYWMQFATTDWFDV